MMNIERTKMKEPEAGQMLRYERTIRLREEFIERQASGKVVIHADERGWQQNRQGLGLTYLNPLIEDTCLRDWVVFVHDIKTHSGKHRHQGGLVIFVLEGSGYTILNNEREDWKAGDLLMLPLVPGGIEHQHFNNGDESCKWIAFLYLPYWDLVASEMTQVEVHPDFKDAGTGTSATSLAASAIGKKLSDLPSKSSQKVEGNGTPTVLDQMLELRDQQRLKWSSGRKVMRLEDTVLEHNQIAPTRWYLHPFSSDACLNTLVVRVVELPPESRSARYRYQGGTIIYVMEGNGCTIVDGVRHNWRATDLLDLPLPRDGVIVEHINEGQGPARLLMVDPNTWHALGVDRSSGFDILSQPVISGK